MTLDRLKEIFEKNKKEGKNCYAINSGSYGEFILGELTIIRSIKENEITLFRTFNNTISIINEDALSKFSYRH